MSSRSPCPFRLKHSMHARPVRYESLMRLPPRTPAGFLYSPSASPCCISTDASRSFQNMNAALVLQMEDCSRGTAYIPCHILREEAVLEGVLRLGRQSILW